MLVPIVALVAAYLAVAGERESGSLKVLLGLPPTRGEVVFGKFLGRAGVVGLGVAGGFAVSGVVTGVIFGELPLFDFLAVTVLTVALGVSFVGIAIGISSVSTSRSRAMTLAVGVYLLLTILWDLVPQGAHILVAGSMPGQTVPGWFVLLQGTSPSGAYNALVQRLLMDTDAALVARLGGEVPMYLHGSTFIGVLFVWTVLPPLVGYLRFRVADLS